MRKLGKRNNLEEGTLVAYACYCNCMCFAGPSDCKCGSRVGTEQQISNMEKVNNVKSNMQGTLIAQI